jgi:hypothetical protein
MQSSARGAFADARQIRIRIRRCKGCYDRR